MTLGKPLNLSGSLLEQAHHKAAFVLTFRDCASGEAEGENRQKNFVWGHSLVHTVSHHSAACGKVASELPC